jgi:hypothetical protein
MKKNKIHNITNSGFNTPEDYFSNLEDRIISNIKLNETIKEPGFKIPDSYFDALEDTILNKVQDDKKSKVIPLFSKRTIISVTSVAAAIVLLFNLNIFNKNISFDAIDTDDLENYVTNQEFETLDLGVEIIEDIDISSFVGLDESISDASLENYLYYTSDFEDLISE